MSLFPKNLNEFAASMGIPRGPKSNVYLVDPVNGATGNTGISWESPLLDIEAAYAKCTDAQHDCVLFLSGATADYPAASITWSKNYTHLIGLSSGVYGLGQRSRVVMQAATAVTPTITFSGAGNIIKNMQLNQEKAAGAASGVAIVSGSRNYFENVFFMAPTATDAASYSLKMNGSENVFKHCTIGQYTNFRSAASYGLWLHGATAVSRNLFDECMFMAWSGGTPSTHAHVLVDADIVTVPWITIFKDCMFLNNYGGGTIQAQAIDDNSTATGHQIVLWGKNSFVGCTAVADTLTYVMNQSKFAGGLMAALSES
jgi:hypothetical protein